jgi:hypothetical protein
MKAYKNTKVNWAKSQALIGKLLDSRGIKDVRFTFLQTQFQLICEFNYPVVIEKKDAIIGIRILIPIKDESEQGKNQIHRALFYYLKSKFEALDFGLVEFIQEFMAHIIVVDKSGTSKTAYQVFSPQYNRSLIEGKQGEIKMIE